MTICKYSNQKKYPFSLPSLPFAKDAFGDLLSSETFDYHHGKHHNSYVNNLNKFIEEEFDNFKDNSLEEIIKNSQDNPKIFNNAAQIWNHSFYWKSISPNKEDHNISEDLQELIDNSFGDYDEFIAHFTTSAIGNFGSGWTWLVYNSNSKLLEIVNTSNAQTVITTENLHPLMNIDVWEHAYYVDYRNNRPSYVEKFMTNMINWSFANENLRNILQ